jgi:predicted transcriptional regulator
MKTLAVELDDELHAQLTMLGQVLNKPVKKLMYEGVKDHVDQLRKSPEVIAKAKALREAFDADVTVRRNALDGLLDPSKPWPNRANGDDKAKPAKPAKAAAAQA